MSIGITEVRPGTTIEIDGEIFYTVEYQHVKMAQRAWVRAKLKNLRTGAIFEKTFNVDEKVERAHIDRREMQYLYHDEDMYHFMDKENFNQVGIPAKKLGDTIKYLVEGYTLTILFYGEEALDVDMEASVVLKVVEAPPGYKGDTVSGALKPATLESGITVNVPLFVNEGDSIKVDTRTGKYLERA